MNKPNEANEFLSLVVDNIDSLLFIVNKDLRVMKVNKAGKNILKKNDEDIINEYFGNSLNCEYVFEKDEDCQKTTYCKKCKFRLTAVDAFNKIESHKKEISRRIYLNGKPTLKYFEVTSKLINYNDEEMILLIINDISILKEKEKSLKKINDLKDKFLSVVSHDLKNPIGAIKSLAFLLSEEIGDEQQLEYIKEINNSSEYMLNLVTDLLDINKIRKGELGVNKNKENYKDLLKEVISYNKIKADEKNINIILDAPNLEVYLDRDKIIQVLNNLISNAIKFSNYGGTISIIVLVKSGEVFTHIKDNGIGIPEEELENIFDEFFKCSNNTIDSQKSTGLGLSIVKSIMDSHGGRVGVKSKKGEGSDFFFTIKVDN